MQAKARIYITLVSLVGLVITFYQMTHWSSHDPIRYFAYLIIAILASGMKVKLPGITGTMSVNFLFVLIGIIDLGLPESLTIGCSGTLIQCLWHAKSRPKLVRVVFNTASMAIAVAISYNVYHSLQSFIIPNGQPFLLVLAASVFFLVNTIPVAEVIALTERKRLGKIWYDCYFWCFPYYIGGASVAWLLNVVSHRMTWHISVLLLPMMYFIYRSYRLYLDRLEDEKKHVEHMAGLHLRTIEALALAIEAKDHTTHEHLRRVRVYALAVGQELGLSEPEMQALRAAALLHDIGKLAVPEHIISKPGKLTPEEFEKMKIHPVVGGEILEQVQFPYPVVPIVRAHHEKWDGSGYPSGLKGDEIPIGARILSAVDCLDALACDRQYRRALPLDQAMEIVAGEAGKSFDPRVVNILKRHYVELERLANAQTVARPKLSTALKIERGQAPAAGFERPGQEIIQPNAARDPLSSIAAARQEVQMLFELTQDLGNSLSLDDTLSVVAVRLRRLVPYDSMAVYMLRDGKLIPEYVTGENFRLFSSLQIPVGEGLSGWVAANRKPFLNGNPSLESGYLNDETKFTTLRSALSVPLEGLNGTVGVLTLYRSGKDAFSKDNLRIILAISAKISLAIENALRYRQIENSATTDYLTGLPNARSLFLRLDSELARCQRLNIPLAVLVCDLDGFKQVNDRYGHLEGNRVLHYVAQTLKESCREYDYVARMGGDEFVLLLPDVTAETLYHRIENLRKVACGADQLFVGECALSLSVGEACYPLDGAQAEELLAEADRRMYKAKQRQKQERHRETLPVPEPKVVTLAIQ